MKMRRSLSFAAIGMMVALVACSETTKQQAAGPQTTTLASAGTFGPSAPNCRAALTPLGNPSIVAQPNLPENLRSAAGIYEGNDWGGQLCTALAITDVKADGSAKLIYANSSNGALNIERRVMEYDVQIVGNQVQPIDLEFSQRKLSFRFMPDGRLRGDIVANGVSSSWGYYVKTLGTMAAKQ